MKKHHTTIVLLTLFFTGLIVLWWADYAEVPTTREREATRHLVLPELRTLPIGEIRRVEVVQRDEDEAKTGPPRRLVFERRGQGWQMLEPVDAAADPSRVETLVQNLKNLARSPEAGTIEEPAAKYGLEPPAAIARVFRNSGDEPAAVLELGRSVRDRLYVRPGGKPGIEVVDARLFKGIGDPAPGWREKSIFNLPTFQVGGLDIAGPGRALKAERVEGHWSLRTPIRAPGDDAKVEEVLAELCSLRVADGPNGFVADDVRDPAAYGLDEEHATRVELTPVSRRDAPQALLVGKSPPDRPDRVYAMQAGQDDVVLVDARGFRDLGADPNALRSHKVADINPALVSDLRVEAEGRTFHLARTAAGWQVVEPVRERADEESVSLLLRRLQALETSEFFDPQAVSKTGLEAPTVAVKVWQFKAGDRPPAEPAAGPRGELRLDLRLGRQDALKKIVFARVEGDRAVLAVPDAFLDVLPKNELAFRQRSLLSLSPSQVARLTIDRGDETIVLEPAATGTPNQWRMRSPVDAPADDEAVTKALLALSDLRAERLITDRPGNEAQFGLGTPTLRVSWATQPEATKDQAAPDPASQTLTVGARVPKSESWFATLGRGPLVFTLPDAVVLQFRSEFRNHRVLAFSPRQVSRIVLAWPERSLAFDHHPTPRGGLSDWDPAPGTNASGFDLSRISSLATDLSRLQTRRFVQHAGPFPASTGLANPRLTVEVDLAGGKSKRVVRVGNVAEGEEFYATTDAGNEGSVFLLSGSGWSELINPRRARGGGELPDDVFAPDTAKPPG